MIAGIVFIAIRTPNLTLLSFKVFLYITIKGYVLRMEAKSYKELRFEGNPPTHTHTHTHVIT
jgi:hypothetical protein